MGGFHEGRSGASFWPCLLVNVAFGCLSLPAMGQTCASCAVGGDLSGTLPNPKVQSVTGAAGAFNFSTATEFLPRQIGSITGSCTGGEFAGLAGSTPTPYWCSSSTVWQQFPLFDTSGNLPIGNPSSPTQGSVIIYSGTSGGQVSLTVPATLSSAYLATLPSGTTTLAGLAVSNAYTNANNFTLGTVTLPNSSGYAPATEAIVGYDTAQHKYVAGGDQSTAGSFARVDLFQVPAPSSPDLICAMAGDTVGGLVCSNTSAPGTTLTNFVTAFNMPANFLILDKSLRITAGFVVFTPATGVEDFALSLYAGAVPLYTSNAYIAGLPASLSGITFEMTWDVLTVNASSNHLIVTSTMPALPGADTTQMYNHTAQPVTVLIGTTEVIQAAVQYQTTSACGGTTCAGNGLQLRWLRVEEIN